MVLKVNVKIEQRFMVRFAPLFSVRRQLSDLGIVLEENATDYDAQIVQTSLLRADPEAFLNDRCTILYDRADAATLSDHPFLRSLIQDPRIRVWIREYTLRDPALHNVPMVSGRYHYTLISGNAEPKMPRAVVPVSDLGKIRTIMPVYSYPFFDLPRKFQRVPLDRRRIALFYAGTIDYVEPIVTQHRRMAGKALETLENVPRLVGYGRVLQRATFLQTLTQTKIFLSPFGLGEFSWKDYEAIYAGCVLVKPEADFVTTYGFDIYGKNRYCVSCKHDFSDLKDIVDDILSNEARYQQLADQARAELLKAAELESYATDVAGVIKEAVEM